VSLRDRWDEEARQWALFARTPGHDIAHERLNFPAFLELLPPPGRATLDLGCGEGRVGAELERRGHRVIGVDSSPQMVELARERHEAIVADSTALPFQDGAFDLVTAYMSLMNMDDIDGAVREAARVLEPGGRLCASVLHPISAAGEWLDKEDVESPFVVARYFDAPTKVWVSDRSGIRMTFHDRPIPVSTYTGALETAGLLIEALHEPVPDDALVRELPEAARLRRIPLFLHLRAVRPSNSLLQG
jgi:SAM-dependent methyltransferase